MKLGDIDLFVFDFDGTLVQSNEIKRNTFYEITSHLDGAGDLLPALMARADLDRYGIALELARHIDGADAQALVEAYTDRCEQLIRSCPEVPGASELLRVLADQDRPAVVNSATPEEDLRKAIADRSFAPHLRHVFGRPCSKSENLRKAMTLCGTDPERTIMIGDGETDRTGASEVRCRFLAIRSDQNDFSSAPPYLAENLSQVIDWI